MATIRKRVKKAKQPTTIVGVRLTQDMLDLLDRFAEDLAENVPIPGFSMTRSGAVRVLIEEALKTRGYMS